MNKRLILTRHGQTEAAGVAEDHLRFLSDQGKIKQRQMAEKIKPLIQEPALLLASPLLRTMQSAAILSEVLNLDVMQEPNLAYDFHEKALLKRLNNEPYKTLVLVGHNPSIAEFANHLIGKRAFSWGFDTSGFAIVDFEDKVEFAAGHLL